MNNNGNNAEKTAFEQSTEKGAARIFELPEKFDCSKRPYIKSTETVSMIMLDVIIALLPSFAWGVYVFGPRALLIALISVAASVGFEAASRFLMHRKVTLTDLSATITGLLIAMCLPVTVPLWVPLFSAFFAIVVVKQLFGGIGKNILNPALSAVALMSLWDDVVFVFTKPGEVVTSLAYTLSESDFIAGSSPLEALKSGVLPNESIFEMMIGNCSGAIGEVSSLLLIAGGLYLLFRRVISWHIPISFIGTVALLTFAFPKYNGVAADFMLYEIFSGALIITAFFMATDYTTSPVSDGGKLIFGVGCGVITVFIRYFGISIEGTAFAVLIMNLLVPHIEKITKPRSFGK